jgi:hypothetical protein
MGSTVRIRRRLDSETVHLPELHDMLGREVEITVREVDDALLDDRHPLRGSVLRYDDPFDPADADEAWEALG